VSYAYDDAHQLTYLSDTLGARVHYTLDDARNRTGEDTKDTGGVLMQELTRAYDALNRIHTVSGSMQ